MIICLENQLLTLTIQFSDIPGQDYSSPWRGCKIELFCMPKRGTADILGPQGHKFEQI